MADGSDFMKNIVDLVLAFSTVGLAGFTAWMAFETRRLAKEGHDSSILMELHHQERLAPILYFYPCTTDSCLGGIHFDWAENPRGCRLRISGILHNSGLGPAMNPKITITIPTYPLPITLIAYPVGSQEKQEYHREEIYPDINKTDWNNLYNNQETWGMLIKYTDLFGNPYSTELKHVPYRENKEVIPFLIQK